MAAEKQRASKRQVPETHGRGPGAVVMDSIGPLLATTHPAIGGIAAYFGGWSPDVHPPPRSASSLLAFAAGERWLPEVPIHGPRDLIISFDVSTLPAVSLASISKTETKVGAAVGRGPVVTDQEQIPVSPDDSFCPWIQYLQGMTGTEEMTRGEKEHGRRHPKQSRDDPATAVGFYVTYARTGQDRTNTLV
ncbi:hypothetical protein CSOJ01_01217 [Colletotrichum sojae]|uniref:Uncharacterized protein n=1 Tax=Colletotrichum sojae TaxID=2175907 RepID=A0A8H6JW13_9PEZI|nr:hypothetical protein CSOJ01_01217 [Colletotrichum sojae]